jgi:hypothetical protein
LAFTSEKRNGRGAPQAGVVILPDPDEKPILLLMRVMREVPMVLPSSLMIAASTVKLKSL